TALAVPRARYRLCRHPARRDFWPYSCLTPGPSARQRRWQCGPSYRSPTRALGRASACSFSGRPAPGSKGELAARRRRCRPGAREDARAFRVVLVLQDDGGVVVEADVGAVGSAVLLGLADDDRFHDFALLDRATRRGHFDGGDDHVADRGLELRAAGDHANTHE